MKKKNAVRILLAGMMWFSGYAWAQDYWVVPEVEVRASMETSAEVSMEMVDIEKRGKGVMQTIPDVLDNVPGLDIQSRSILTPKSSQVKIRGLDERRSLIMVDGRPLNGTGVMGGQFVDWSSISLQNWKTIALGKGAFSAKYGNTLGGTINLVPVMPGPEPEYRVFAGVKSYDTYSTGMSGSGRYKNLEALIAGGYQTTDGYLRNSDAQRTDFSGRFTFHTGDTGRIIAGIRYTDGTFGMPVNNEEQNPWYDASYPRCVGSYLIGPGLSFPSGDSFGDNSYYTKKRTEFDLGVNNEINGFDSEVKLYFNNEKRTDVLYSMNTGAKVLERDSQPDRSWGWVVRSEKATTSHRVGFGLDANYQGYEGTKITSLASGYFKKTPTNGTDELDATRVHGAYVDDTWAVTDQVELYVGIRYENYYGDRTASQVTGYNPAGKPTGFVDINPQFDEQAVLPKLGLLYRPTNGISLYARLARATRFPDNPVFYWYYGGYRPEVDTNSSVVRKELTYEDSIQYEAGITFTRLPETKIKLTGYHYRVDDYIRWIFGYSPSRLVYNIDRVDFTGVELEAETKILDNLSGFANYTWQKTQKEGDVLDGSNALSDKLSELPELKANLGLTHRYKDNMETRITLRWVDDRQVPYGSSGSAVDGTPVGQTTTLKDMKDYFLVDLSLQYTLWTGKSRGTFSCGIENLLDEEYEEEYGFPNPDRTFYAGLKITF